MCTTCVSTESSYTTETLEKHSGWWEKGRMEIFLKWNISMANTRVRLDRIGDWFTTLVSPWQPLSDHCLADLCPATYWYQLVETLRSHYITNWGPWRPSGMVRVMGVIYCHSPQKYGIHSPQDHYRTLEKTGFVAGDAVGQTGAAQEAVCHPSSYKCRPDDWRWATHELKVSSKAWERCVMDVQYLQA